MLKNATLVWCASRPDAPDLFFSWRGQQSSKTRMKGLDTMRGKEGRKEVARVKRRRAHTSPHSHTAPHNSPDSADRDYLINLGLNMTGHDLK